MNETKVAEDSLTMLSLFKDALPLLGVMVGAGLHYIFSRSSELKRHERTLRVEAYSNYLQSVGEMESIEVSPDTVRQSDVFARAIAAKVRVCVHGSESVVNALSKFEGAQGQGLTEEKKNYLIEFMVAVRVDCGAQGARLPKEAIEKILFGKKESPNAANAADRKSGG
jgi:hypothetical protein